MGDHNYALWFVMNLRQPSSIHGLQLYHSQISTLTNLLMMQASSSTIHCSKCIQGYTLATITFAVTSYDSCLAHIRDKQ